jgi:hypothetical protein
MAWTEFHLAYGGRDSASLAEVAKSNAGSVVGLWAREAQGRLDLERGTAALYTNRDDAAIALSDARKAFSEVIAEGSAYPQLLQLALLGLAQAQEASGNLDAAREYYQQVTEKFPDSPAGQQAAVRLATVREPEVASFYNWFSRQKPKPSSQFSLPNLPGMPQDLTKLPESPDLPPPPEFSPLAPATDVPTTTAPESGTKEPKEETKQEKPKEKETEEKDTKETKSQSEKPDPPAAEPAKSPEPTTPDKDP